jgi:flagellin
MTRINTNVSSLIAQKTLSRSNMDLQSALTRLSTGLRINVGKDDPAGLIASEALRSDITSVEKAITNTERANQVIATADSALGQVSVLLNDIRGLATEAANTGAMSDEQIAANQLQVDSSLEAINRIAQTTSFQGRKLLDGSLGFVTTAGTGAGNIADLEINQANLGTTGTISVDINVATAATKAGLTTTITESSAIAAADASLFISGEQIDITLDNTATAVAGASGNGITVNVIESDSVIEGEVLTAFDETNGALNVTIASTTVTTDTTIGDIAAAILAMSEVSAVDDNGGTAVVYTHGGDGTTTSATFANGADAVAGLEADLVFELRGNTGSEVFSFAEGTAATDVVAAINLVSDATGVAASYATNTLTLASVDYGSDALVEINMISETGSATTFSTNLANEIGAAVRDIGADIVATVNGISANGSGNALSINTATLDLNATITAAATGSMQFTIDGGGAMFQIGPDVVSNQQARIGIQSMNSASLGGKTGAMYELASGGSASLANDPTTAAKIVDEAISSVASLRGRLGAFQKNTLESNMFTLGDTLTNLTDAESSIRDADFAAESAKLTRAQILVQSGTSVLAIANQNPQNVLSLLR